MHMSDSLERRVEELEQRLSEVERVLRICRVAKPQAAPPQSPAAARSAPLVAPSVQYSSDVKCAPAPPPLVAPSVLSYQPKRLPTETSHANPLEQVIGGKWAGWIGAVVLVIGAALGIKYAYDAGLFPTI